MKIRPSFKTNNWHLSAADGIYHLICFFPSRRRQEKLLIEWKVEERRRRRLPISIFPSISLHFHPRRRRFFGSVFDFDELSVWCQVQLIPWRHFRPLNSQTSTLYCMNTHFLYCVHPRVCTPPTCPPHQSLFIANLQRNACLFCSRALVVLQFGSFPPQLSHNKHQPSPAGWGMLFVRLHNTDDGNVMFYGGSNLIHTFEYWADMQHHSASKANFLADRKSSTAINNKRARNSRKVKFG